MTDDWTPDARTLEWAAEQADEDDAAWGAVIDGEWLRALAASVANGEEALRG